MSRVDREKRAPLFERCICQGTQQYCDWMAWKSRQLARLKRPLLLDGGMGTALIARGLEVNAEPTAAWNLSRQDEVVAIHRAYANAGVDALHTNTFAANPAALAKYARKDARELNLVAVELVRSVARGALVVGDMGSTGLVPAPEGDADLQELEDAFAEQSHALWQGGVDFLHLETMHHPKEIRAAVRGCGQGAPSLDVVVSLSVARSGDEFRSASGYSLETLIAVLMEESVSAIGCNCWLDPGAMASVVGILLGLDLGPVFAQPTVAPVDAAPIYPGEFAEGVSQLASAGAFAVGGCCGTSPSDLEATRRTLDELTANWTTPGH